MTTIVARGSSKLEILVRVFVTERATLDRAIDCFFFGGARRGGETLVHGMQVDNGSVVVVLVTLTLIIALT